MIYNVAQLLKSAPGTTMDVELDSEDSLDLRDGEADLAGPVTGQMRLHRTNQGVFVDGEAHVPVRLECTRCLRSFTTTLDFPVQEEFYPVINVTSGEAVSGPHDEDAFAIDRHHQIDLREPIRQALVLALPMKPLHDEACAGLCQTCGKDLNEGPCDCQPEEVDPRFSGLRALFAEASEGGQS